MFFRKSRIIVFLQKSSIELFGPQVDGTERYDFEKDTFKNLEIKDSNALREAIIIFLARTSIKKQQAVLVLGRDLLFEETQPYSSQDEVKERANKFLNGLKLPAEKVANEMLTNGKEVYLFATNKEIYEVVAEAFASVGWDIGSVIPVTLLDIKKEEITQEDAVALLKDEKLVKTGDLLEKNPVDLSFTPKPSLEKESAKEEVEEEKLEEKKTEEVEPKEEKKTSKKGKEEKEVEEIDTKETKKEKEEEEEKQKEEERASRLSKEKDKEELLEAGNFLPEKRGKGYFKFLIIAFLIGVLIGIPIFVGYRFYQKGITLSGDDVKKEEVSNITPTQEPTPTQQASIAKDELKIQVQNGSGVSGQAKQVQGLLAQDGYKNIDTGNADLPNTSTTELQVVDGVSAEDRAAIQKSLQTTFDKVTISDLPSSSSYDVVIVTGQ